MTRQNTGGRVLAVLGFFLLFDMIGAFFLLQFHGEPLTSWPDAPNAPFHVGNDVLYFLIFLFATSIVLYIATRYLSLLDRRQTTLVVATSAALRTAIGYLTWANPVLGMQLLYLSFKVRPWPLPALGFISAAAIDTALVAIVLVWQVRRAHVVRIAGP
jgi:hypothetical protein